MSVARWGQRHTKEEILANPLMRFSNVDQHSFEPIPRHQVGRTGSGRPNPLTQGDHSGSGITWADMAGKHSLIRI